MMHLDWSEISTTSGSAEALEAGFYSLVVPMCSGQIRNISNDPLMDSDGSSDRHLIQHMTNAMKAVIVMTVDISNASNHLNDFLLCLSSAHLSL